MSNDPTALHLEIVVVPRGKAYVGRLVVTRGNEALGTRQFEDTECAEVVAALALSAALSIDPDAKLEAETELQPHEAGSTSGGADERPPGTSAETPPSPSQGQANPATGTANQAQGGGEPAGELEPLYPTNEKPKASIFSVGPEVALGFAFEPKAELGFGLALGLHRVPDRTWFPVETSLAFDYLSTRSTRGNDPVRLDWYTFRAGYCPLRAGSESALSACAVGYGGWVQARGLLVDTPREVTRGFVTVGLGLHGRVHLGMGWLLNADLDLGVPLSQRSFAIDPENEVVASSRPVGVVFTVGVRRAF